jgi:hypothetical protein
MQRNLLHDGVFCAYIDESSSLTVVLIQLMLMMRLLFFMDRRIWLWDLFREIMAFFSYVYIKIIKNVNSFIDCS